MSRWQSIIHDQLEFDLQRTAVVEAAKVLFHDDLEFGEPQEVWEGGIKFLWTCLSFV